MIQRKRVLCDKWSGPKPLRSLGHRWTAKTVSPREGETNQGAQSGAQRCGRDNLEERITHLKSHANA